MKKIASAVTAAILLMVLAACATTPTGEPVRVQCPACGYEFEAPIGGD